ncbi:AMP-binding protein [Promethearchaeum syntrophicum]|uniref:AMP-binding protein n=1 Tax=Promethearchaeum syntrophicum TaxID=2594042 RepID=A0A5B9D8H1_9ARCH|nr:AMP-binding protein [Candidatus Prometheoarchaeum syntrophicum]QEE15404.1 3-hydroxypropionyl-coenzyme A synthetase [Candidatus Prometheoarchaeum syntrophicum]
MNLTQYIFENSKNLNNKYAIFQGDEKYSFSELYSLILKISKKLDDFQLSLDEKIMIVSDNSLFFIAAYFGIIASGRVAVPLHNQFGEQNFKYVIDSCNVSCFFIQKKYVKKFEKYGISTKILFTDDNLEDAITVFDLKNEKGIIKPINEKAKLAVIIFTSGSTGIPKGVMQSHLNIIHNSNSIIEYLQLNQNDRVMVVLPFSYCFGTSLLHTHLRVGGQIVLNNRFMFPGKVLKEINEKKCTVFAGVPSTYQILLRRSPFKKMTFPTLRLIQQAGGKLANTFISELREILPNTQIFIMYGQTEATARLSYLPPNLLDTKLGSIGKGIPNTILEVLNKEGKPIKYGETGELVASGDNITLGYWKDPETTVKTFKNGKLYTGDIGTVDEEGYIFLTDREKNILKIGGFRVSPKEVEDYITQLDDVVEVGIIGISDDILGEAMKAYISLVENSKLTEKMIISYCKNHFPNHKIPKEYEFLNSLPKNNSNKLDRVKLKQMHKEKKGN